MDELTFDWNLVPAEGAPAPVATGVLFDETLRDGIQAPAVRTPALAEKLRLIDHMVLAGVPAADLGFPGSSPEAAAECQAIARHIAGAGHRLAQGYAGRTHPADIRAISEVAQAGGVAVDAYIFIGVSPLRRYVEGWDTRSIVDSIRTSAAECRRGGVEFVLVLEDAARCTPQLLGELYDAAIGEGVRRVTLCDTVGVARPVGAEALIGWSARYFAYRGHDVGLEWHGHNDRGLALANSLAALAAGCVRVHGTVLGIGERAGNAAIDQLMVNRHLDGSPAADLTAVRRYCEYAAEVLRHPVPANYPAVGRDVFTTSAGVHAAAILKAHGKGDPRLKDAVYSSVPARLLGREQRVLVDASSGASNVRYWLAVRGQDADETAVQTVLRAAKTHDGPLSDDEIGALLAGPR